MSEEFKYVDNVVQANLILKKCFETIDRLNDEIYTEKIIRGSKYRETIKKLKNKNIKFPEMDLRDYFAAKVMGALIKHEADHISHCGHDNIDYRFPFFDEDLDGGDDIKDVAARCYQFADAMMKARAKL